MNRGAAAARAPRKLPHAGIGDQMQKQKQPRITQISQIHMHRANVVRGTPNDAVVFACLPEAAMNIAFWRCLHKIRENPCNPWLLFACNG